MNREIRLENGEKIFATGFITAAVTEAVVTLVANGTHFTWVGTVFGTIGAVLMLLLANSIYQGNRTALTAAVVIALVQIALGVLGLVASLGLLPVPETLSWLALPYPWLAVGKIMAYALLLAFLLCSGSVQDFLAWRRGEQVPEYHTTEAVEPRPTLPPSGVTVALSDQQTASYNWLPLLMQTAGAVLAVLGLVRLVYGILGLKTAGTPGGLLLVDGSATLLLGLLLALPAAAFNLLKSEGPDLAYIMNAVRSLKTYYSLQIVLSVVLAGVLVLSLVIR
jgi:hypothetical protein